MIRFILCLLGYHNWKVLTKSDAKSIFHVVTICPDCKKFGAYKICEAPKDDEKDALTEEE